MPLRRSAVWSDPRVKPAVGQAYLDRTHKLARGLHGVWLINEKGGTFVKDYSGGAFNGRLTNADAVRAAVPGAGTLGFKNTGSSNAQIQIQPAMGLSGNVGYSIFGRWRPLGDGSAGHRLFAWGVASTRNMVILGRNTSTRTGVFWFGDDMTADNPSTENSTDLLRDIATTYDAVANVRQLFYQGIRIAGPTAPSGTANFTDNNYTIANFSNSQVNSNAWVDFVYLWKHRSLLTSEVEWLHVEPFIAFKPVIYRRVFFLAANTRPIVYPTSRAAIQPPETFTVHGDDYRRNMVGAWSFSSPGVGARIHNHAPQWSAIALDNAVVHAKIENFGTQDAWKLQDGARTYSVTGPAPGGSKATNAWVDLGDPIGTNDDFTVLVGWVPAALTGPGSGVGGLFCRGQDGSGSGWSIFIRHDGSDQITCATVLGGAQQTVSYTAAGLKPGKANFVAFRCRQGSNLAACINGGRIVTVATGNVALRTSGEGCGMALNPVAVNNLPMDGAIFCFLWRRALNDAQLAELTVQPWKLWSRTEQDGGEVPTTKESRHEIGLPIEAIQNERRNEPQLPIEALQHERRHEVLLNIESAGTLSNQIDLPIESGGEVEGSFGQVFDILRSDSAPFPHFFDILTTGQETPLTHTFDIFDAGTALDMTFDIFRENLQNARKSDDVQRPIAEVVFNN